MAWISVHDHVDGKKLRRMSKMLNCSKAESLGIFENKTAANGFAFNFRVTAERGPSGEGGYITSVQGGFQ